MAVCPQHKSWEAVQTTVTDSSWFVWDFLGFSTKSPLSWETPPVQGNWDDCSLCSRATSEGVAWR